MILYHGSTISVPNPSVHKSRANLDFGKGFYLTELKTQAIRWAKRKAALMHGVPILNVYEFDEDAFMNGKVLTFENNDEAWVNFVCKNRRGEPVQTADLIIGGVADDKVVEAVDMYMQGLWGLQETLNALSYYEISNQYCFTNQQFLNKHLQFVESFEV
jgi:hypothetical protein